MGHLPRGCCMAEKLKSHSLFAGNEASTDVNGYRGETNMIEQAFISGMKGMNKSRIMKRFFRMSGWDYLKL